MGGIIEGIRRKDILEIPEFVVRELIVNAVAHRDYSMTGSTINIAIFDDRLEFSSPGPLPSGVTPENIKDKHVVRNKIITDYLYNMKYIEGFGTGWDRIIESMNEYGLPIPEILDTGSSVKVVVERATKTAPNKKGRTKRALTKRQRIILANLEVKKKYTLKQIMQLIGSSSELGTRRVLTELQKKGYLDFVFEEKDVIRVKSR